MPTFARLVGALLLAALGAYTVSRVRAYLPDWQPAGMLMLVAAMVGLVVGWRFTGRHLDRGKGNPLAIGFGSAVLLTLWTALLFAMKEMLDKALKGKYGGSPTDAVQDVFSLMIEYAQDYLLKQDVLLSLAVGGMAAGVVTWLVGRYMR